MKKDYEFVIRVIRNKENKIGHYPAIRKLINLWEYKWSGHTEHNVYEIYLHSLKLNLKKSFR